MDNDLQRLLWHDFDGSKNCSVAAKFAAQLGQNYPLNPMAVPVETLWNFISACGPFPLGDITIGQVVDWAQRHNETADTIYEFPLSDLRQDIISKCPRDFCRSLNWGGNSDLAGVGVRHL